MVKDQLQGNKLTTATEENRFWVRESYWLWSHGPTWACAVHFAMPSTDHLDSPYNYCSSSSFDRFPKSGTPQPVGCEQENYHGDWQTVYIQSYKKVYFHQDCGTSFPSLCRQAIMTRPEDIIYYVLNVSSRNHIIYSWYDYKTVEVLLDNCPGTHPPKFKSNSNLSGVNDSERKKLSGYPGLFEVIQETQTLHSYSTVRFQAFWMTKSNLLLTSHGTLVRNGYQIMWFRRNTVRRQPRWAWWLEFHMQPYTQCMTHNPRKCYETVRVLVMTGEKRSC